MNAQHAAADFPAAFAAQLDSHRSYLLRAARMKLRDPADAEDVVQEAVIAAWKGRAGFRGQSALRTWLVGILNHKIVDLIRDKQRRPAVSWDEIAEFAGDEEGAGAAEAGHASLSEGVAVAYERRQLCEQVLGELEAYSPKAARIFVLRELEGEDTRAICRRLQVSSANCYVLLHRARQFLHQRFDAFAAAA
ncbi:MAG: sigma-70 family RNA polymerase sigma factor [Betaproteobacteria bacterium]|nr:sigma-70 family RNA polymerase sigma factor [Betaproteobacteria bacterium]